jgi:hypothetical protein
MLVRSLLARAAGCLLVAVAAAGCGDQESASTGDRPAAGGGKKGPAAPPLGKPDLVVSPAQWRADFKKDSSAARAKYKGKVIEMSGTVDSARPDPYGQVGYINLEVPNDFEGVRCVLADKKPWRRVSPGSKVTVRGRSSAVIAGDLRPCEIVKAGPNPGVVISARELARQFAADRKEAARKYGDKWAYVKGEVVEKTSSKGCAVLLKLKGDKGVGVHCCFGEAYKRGLERVRVGSQVDVFGSLQVPTAPRETTVSVLICVLTDAK